MWGAVLARAHLELVMVGLGGPALQHEDGAAGGLLGGAVLGALGGTTRGEVGGRQGLAVRAWCAERHGAVGRRGAPSACPARARLPTYRALDLEGDLGEGQDLGLGLNGPLAGGDPGAGVARVAAVGASGLAAREGRRRLGCACARGGRGGMGEMRGAGRRCGTCWGRARHRRGGRRRERHLGGPHGRTAAAGAMGQCRCFVSCPTRHP